LVVFVKEILGGACVPLTCACPAQ